MTGAPPFPRPPAVPHRSAPSFGTQPPSAPIDSAQGAASAASAPNHGAMDPNPNPADVSRAVAAASGADAAPLSNVTNTYTSGIDPTVLHELQQSTRANQRKRGGSKAKWSKQEVRRPRRSVPLAPPTSLHDGGPGWRETGRPAREAGGGVGLNI